MQSADLNLTTTITGHQRYLFIKLPPGPADAGLAGAIGRLGDGMENMHHVEGPPLAEAFRRGRFQILRAEPSMSRDQGLSHLAVMDADGLIRLEGEASEPLLEYEAGLRALLEPAGGSVETLFGVQRPRSYTSHAMTQYAYARAQQPGPGSAHPLGVVTPMNKNADWWGMDWMHRESFFLPRYDANESMVLKGHALAADAGIACITRRLVHAPEGYGKEDGYDFVGYFEFAEADASTFSAVMEALRDTEQNPEWAYITEGPEWWGRRVSGPAELWAA
jgi:chlorite dismutase